ncbi:MAG: hypothetical protein WA087_02885 [Candidatus Saccharimonadales bacterium]
MQKHHAATCSRVMRGVNFLRVSKWSIGDDNLDEKLRRECRERNIDLCKCTPNDEIAKEAYERAKKKGRYLSAECRYISTLVQVLNSWNGLVLGKAMAIAEDTL